MKSKLLIIDDELSVCTMLCLALSEKYDVAFRTDAEEALAYLPTTNVDVVLLDLKIANHDGIEVLRRIREYDDKIVVIMMTAFGSIKSSVEAMQNGAFNYLTKPLDIEELIAFVEQGLQMKQLTEQVAYLSSELDEKTRYREIVGQSASIKEIYHIIDKVKDVDCSVLITGESGTGKELVAKAIHSEGKRGKERFVVINCAAIPENLLEEELFGHKRGSFTGAVQDKKGKFFVADKGTIFLDEIGDMPLSLQSKLLRVLQDKEFTPLGDITPIKVDVRIITATNQDIPKLIREGKFREDLYYRINVVEIKTPPLRDRKEDVPLLSHYFMEQCASEQNKKITKISDKLLDSLMKYDYPGNVRQLKNIIENAVIFAENGMLDRCRIPSDYSVENTDGEQKSERNALFSDITIKQMERKLIQCALEKYGGRRELTAKALGISVRGLQNKMREYGL